MLTFTNCDKVSLFLNDRLLGSQVMSDTNKAVLNWSIPFEPGVLKAVAYQNGKEVAENILKTAGEPNRIILESNDTSIKADGKDFVSVNILVKDSEGNIVPHAENEITISINGVGVNVGFGMATAGILNLTKIADIMCIKVKHVFLYNPLVKKGLFKLKLNLWD